MIPRFPMKEDAKLIYFAGGLFDHKELIGNQLLANAVMKAAAGRYNILLPQDHETPDGDAIAIRDMNYRNLFACDIFLGNFDGLELDSGTVAEFCIAKMLDMPALLLRTDFRNGGERTTSPDAWNLMCSGYPRTLTYHLNSAVVWAEAKQDPCTFYETIAGGIVKKLDELCAMPPVLTETEKTVQSEIVKRCTGVKDLPR